MGPWAKTRAILEERLALMAPSRRLRLALADEVLTETAARRPIRLLDAGCGDGLLAMALAKRHRDWSVVGVDQRGTMLEGARARAAGRGIGNAEFEEADLTAPLPVAGFDAVLALECLHEIPDDRAALATIAGALVAGGVLALQVPRTGWRPVLPGSPGVWRDEVRHGYEEEELMAMLREAGLEPASVRPTYRSLTAAAQEVRDRIKASPLPVRLLAFPFLAAAVRLEGWGLTWGPPSAFLVVSHLRVPSR